MLKHFFLVRLNLDWEEEQPRPVRRASAVPLFGLSLARVLSSLSRARSLPPSVCERASARAFSRAPNQQPECKVTRAPRESEESDRPLIRNYSTIAGRERGVAREGGRGTKRATKSLEPDTSTVLHGTRKAKSLGEHTRSAHKRPAPLLAELVPHKESTARHTKASAQHPRDRSNITLRDAPYPHIIPHDRTLLPREYVASAPSTPARSHTFCPALD
jgi:hypothetical protein